MSQPALRQYLERKIAEARSLERSLTGDREFSGADYQDGRADALGGVLALLEGIPDGWQPIAAAPKDGTPILAFEQGLEMRVVTWDAAYHGWLSYDGHDFGPTHFFLGTL